MWLEFVLLATKSNRIDFFLDLSSLRYDLSSIKVWSWTQKSRCPVLSSILSSFFKEINLISGVLKGKIDYLKQEFGIESLLLKSVLQFNPSGFDEVLNFTDVDTQHLVSVTSFQREIIDYAKQQSKSIKWFHFTFLNFPALMRPFCFRYPNIIRVFASLFR